MISINKTKYRVVDYFRKTRVPDILRQLEISQWWSAAKLEEEQWKRLRDLLSHCRQNVAYYQDLFNRHQICIEDMKHPDDFKRIPVLTKDIIRKNMERLKARNIHQYKPRPKTTGGSTGQPITVFEDVWSHSYRTACNIRGWKAATDYQLGDRFITVAHGSLLPKNNTLKNKVYFFFQNSDLITSYHLNENRLQEAIRTIQNSKGKLIYGYSSAILMIANYALQNNIKINSSLQAVFTTADMLYPDQRHLIEKAFGIRVFDSYGCPESGLISFECNHHNGYHLNAESAFVEVINKDVSGQGKIISTPLFNYAFPLIRYDTGDIGSLSTKKCDCGRSLPRITKLSGRIRDFVVLKDGRYIHGAFFNHFGPFYRNDWIHKYQIIQEEIDKLTIKVETRRPPLQHELDYITDELKKGLLNDLKITFNLNGVEYPKNGKFRLIISKVPAKWDTG